MREREGAGWRGVKDKEIEEMEEMEEMEEKIWKESLCLSVVF